MPPVLTDHGREVNSPLKGMIKKIGKGQKSWRWKISWTKFLPISWFRIIGTSKCWHLIIWSLVRQRATQKAFGFSGDQVREKPRQYGKNIPTHFPKIRINGGMVTKEKLLWWLTILTATEHVCHIIWKFGLIIIPAISKLRAHQLGHDSKGWL